MKRKSALIASGVLALAALGGGTGIAVASSGGDDSEAKPIEGTELDQASAAALEHTGSGRVTDTEVGDEESYYEVEVTLDDASQVDVQLDRDFNIVGQERDGAGDEGPNDND